ncbi:MAG: hypothetical protein ABWX94_01170 [Candidatus Saccharimonadales bacterium]
MAKQLEDKKERYDGKLSAAERAEFDQLAARLRDTPSGDSDQPHGTPNNQVYDDGFQNAHAGNTPGLKKDSGLPGISSRSSAPGHDEPGKSELSGDDIEGQEAFRDDTFSDPYQLGRGYTAAPEDYDEPDGNMFDRGKRFFKKRQKTVIIGSVFLSLTTGSWLFMLSILPLQWPHFFDNLDFKSMGRLREVGFEGRSRRWVQAYLTARLMDIDGPPDSVHGPNNKTTDNILFRADRVDTGNPFTDWYRTVKTSNFESEMFDKHGIKFTSMSTIQNGVRVTRPAKVTVNDKVVLEFDLQKEGIDADIIERALNGDITAFEEIDRLTGKLDQFVKIEVFGNKEGKKELNKTLKEVMELDEKKWYRGFVRWFMKKNIINQTGMTSFTFFENTKEKWKEKGVSVRNKMLDRVLPTNSKNGALARCIFGVSSCRASSDPSSPDNRNLPTVGTRAPARTGPDGQPLSGGAEDPRLAEMATPGPEISDIQRKVALQTIKVGGFVLNAISFMDALANADKTISDGTISKIVEMARGQQLAGLYAQGKVMAGQFKTENKIGEEVDDSVGLIMNVTNNEAYQTVVNNQPNLVLAAGFTAATDKLSYCSIEHQAEIEKAENKREAEKEFAYNCDQDKIGVSGAKALEAAWKASVGAVLGPLLEVWRNSIGLVSKLFDDLVDAIVGPLMQGIIKVLGLEDNIQEVTAWLMQKAMQFTGAGLMWSETTPSGRIVNLLFQGAAWVAESTARSVGAAETTAQTEVTTTAAYRRIREQKIADTSLYDRYLSLDRHDSMASNILFAIANRPVSQLGESLLGSIGGIFTAPFTIFSNTVNAQDIRGGIDDPYLNSRKIAGIKTYDFPMKECLEKPVIGTIPPKIKDGVWGANGDGSGDMMTPQSATNADELGIFKPEELNWDLLRDSDRWYAELYTKVESDDSKALPVWNCALLDNAVAGGIGGLYGYKGVGAASSSDVIRK